MKRNFLLSGLGVTLLGSFLLTNNTSCSNTTSEQEKEDSLEILLPDMHNANNSLDWTGTYEGVLPCTDCKGIQVVLDINEGNTFKKITIYKNKSNNSLTDSGIIIWDSTGSIITLKNQDGEKYKVEENLLRMLDKDGKVITGNLSDHYMLKKK